jgi:hypothetical protein
MVRSFEWALGDHGRVDGEDRTADRLTGGVAIASLVASAVLMIAGLLLQTHAETGPASVVWTLALLDLALGCWLGWSARRGNEYQSAEQNVVDERAARTAGGGPDPVPRTVVGWEPVEHYSAGHPSTARSPFRDKPAHWPPFDEAEVETGRIQMVTDRVVAADKAAAASASRGSRLPAGEPTGHGQQRVATERRVQLDAETDDTLVGLEQFFDTMDITAIHVDLLSARATYGPASLPNVPVEPDTRVPLEGLVLPDAHAPSGVPVPPVPHGQPRNGRPRRALSSDGEGTPTPPRPRRAAPG